MGRPDTQVDTLGLGFGDFLLSEDITLTEYTESGLYQEYDSLFRDLNFATAWRQYVRSIAHREFRAIPASQLAVDRLAAELVEESLREQREAIETWLLGEPYGWSIVKLGWEKDGQFKLPLTYVSEPLDNYKWLRCSEKIADRVPTDDTGRYELRLMDGSSFQGRSLAGWDKHFLEHSTFFFGARTDSPLGRGWCEALWWWIRILKRGGLEAWAQHLQQHGLPVVKLIRQAVNEVLPSMSMGDDGLKNVLVDAVQTALSMRGVLDLSDFPGLDASFLNSPGQVDPGQLTKYIDSAVKMFVNGPNLSQEGGQYGTQALGNVHATITTEMHKTGARKLCRSLGRLARWITEENVPTASVPALQFVFPDAEKTTETVKIWVDLKEVGFRPTLDKVRETLGEGYEPIPLSSPAPDFAQALEFRQTRKPWDSRMVDAVDAASADHFDSVASQIRHFLLDLADKYPGASDERLFQMARDRIWEVYADLPTEDLARLMGEANTAAHLAGQFAALDENNLLPAEFKQWNAAARERLANGEVRGAFADPKNKKFPIADRSDVAEPCPGRRTRQRPGQGSAAHYCDREEIRLARRTAEIGAGVGEGVGD
ncbi:MAG: DUF935 family protein [Cyanobacteria bacterium SBC]|nr:DUF935 family protein [Cyanobacteria bacterium SBC]